MCASTYGVTKLNRQELYERLWATPAIKLAAEFGISDVGLATICRRHRVPQPPRGHWAKSAAGKATKRKPLPKLDKEALEEIRIFRQHFNAEPTAGVNKWDVPEIAVLDELVDPHPLVMTTRRYLRGATPKIDGIRAPDDATCLRVRVTRGALDRALRLWDALIKYWEDIGGQVGVGKPDRFQNPSTVFELDGDRCRVEMTEVIDRIPTGREVNRFRKYHNCKYKPTGRLILELEYCSDSYRRRWADGKRQQLESMLGSLVVEMRKVIDQKKADRLDLECVARQKAVVEVIREAARKRKEFEEGRRKWLHEQAKAWKQASEIREYLKALHVTVSTGKRRIADPQQWAEWSEWAAWYADYLDPLVKTPDRPEFVQHPRNTPVGELDLTRRTRAVVDKLAVTDKNQLHAIKRPALDEICGHWNPSEWNEICRVLEGLGYDVAGRYRE